MRNLLVKLILVVTVLVSSQIIFVEDSKAACAESSSGVISKAAAEAGCQDEPTSYGVVIYNVYLCTAAPTAPTVASSIDLTNCEEVFSNSSGYSASLSTGAAVSLSGTATRPSDGTYTHGVIIMDNTFAITASKQFEVAYNGQVSGNGVYCATADGSGTAAAATSPTNTSICGTSAVTAGTFTETLTSFDNPFTATGTVTNVAGAGANITAYFVDTDENLAAAEAVVDKLHGVVEFASSATVTSSTTNVDLSFNVGEGMSVDGSGSAMFFGSGPFQATLTVTP